MKNYRGKFKNYLDDLADRKPSPGGGSAVCLFFCAGASLIEKAIVFSISSKTKAKNLDKALKDLKKLRKSIYPCIDQDGYLFNKIMNSNGKKRAEFIKQSTNLVILVARSCEKVFFLAKGIESGIKKSIISDYYIGARAIRLALFGCILNLEANDKMFGKKSKYTVNFKKLLKKWQ